MTRAFKAVIINPDRSCSVHYITKKLKIGPNAFRTSKKSDEVYMIDPRYTINTVTKRGFIPFRYVTSYYKRNIPVPAPMDAMSGGTSVGVISTEIMKDIDNEKLMKKMNEEGKDLITIIKPFDIPGFKDWNYTGISSQEMGVLFNPQFYQMIARSNTNKKADQMFLMQIGCLLGIAFIAYYMTQSLAPNIVEAVGQMISNLKTNVGVK